MSDPTYFDQTDAGTAGTTDGACVDDEAPVDGQTPLADDGLLGEPVDLDANGVTDALVVEISPGVRALVADLDEDGQVDALAVDADGDGVFEMRLVEDGAGGYLAAFDADGDGVFEDEQAVTREELDAQLPGLGEVLDQTFPGAPPVTDGTGEPAGDPGATVQDGRLIGDPQDASEHWFEQAANGFCAPASVAQIVSEYSGTHFADESAFVDLANELGVWVVGPDGVPGLTTPGTLELLEATGVPATVITGDGIDTLAGYLDAGHGVMVAVDSGEIWTGEAQEDDAADHMVVVAGIDVDRGVVLLSDPGSPEGDLEEVPIETFLDAWADADNEMIVCDEPAPDTGTAPSPSTDPSTVAASGMAATVHGAVQQPWVLLPVVVPTAAA
jgi:hypothetical protein